MLTKKTIDLRISEAKQTTDDLVYTFADLLFQAQDEFMQACRESTPEPAKEAAENIEYVRQCWAQNSMEKHAKAA